MNWEDSKIAVDSFSEISKLDIGSALIWVVVISVVVGVLILASDELEKSEILGTGVGVLWKVREIIKFLSNSEF